MKIEIQNLGPIHHFEFDLEKDLHLLYGENNVGKSVAANTIYILLKSFLTQENEIRLKQILRPIAEDLDLEHMGFEQAFTHLFDHTILFSFENSLHNTFKGGDVIGKFLKSGITCFVINVSEEINLRIEVNGYGDFEIVDFPSHIKKSGSSITEAAIETLAEIMIAVSREFQDIYFLPASRSGLYLYLGYFTDILVELSKHRFLLKGNTTVDLMPLSEPTADYFLNLSKVDNKLKNQHLAALSQRIEQKFFKGEIEFHSDTKKITYQPAGTDLMIDLLRAASMISELAPLVLFMKYIIDPVFDKKSLLFIEEPEAHLHPKVQIQLMEIFAELTKHNVKVILTSHSNYMFNKLSNMLLAKEIAPEKVAVYHMEMTDKGSIVNPDMQATTEGIEDHNFADVAQKLYQERLETYQVLNEEGDAYQ